MSNHAALSMLGMALRGGHLVMGEEPVEAVSRARDARVLLVASDAADNTCRRVKHFAEAGQCLWLKLPFSKAELGQTLGRTAVAVAAVTDIGLANAVVHRLAELDPVKYDEAAARLELKAKRAAERRVEQKAHEKNIRTGKYKPKKQDAPRAHPKETSSQEASVRSGRWKSEAPSSQNKQPVRSRPSKENRTRARTKTTPYAHSRPVKKGKGSFRKKES